MRLLLVRFRVMAERFMETETRQSDYVEAIELHLLNEWHLHNARERRAERERRQQPVQRWQPSELHYIVGVAVAMAVSVVILGMWG